VFEYSDAVCVMCIRLLTILSVVCWEVVHLLLNFNGVSLDMHFQTSQIVCVCFLVNDPDYIL